MKKSLFLGLSLCAMALVLSGCAAQAPGTVIPTAPGFFMGLWHGYIAPFAFIAHLFDNSIAVFAVPNNGGWYTFGFLLGIGGLSLSGTINSRDCD